jgi:hypothetical protein
VIQAPLNVMRFDETLYRMLGEKYGQEGIRNFLWEYRKVLLTATPLQNSLLELYGLVSIIDDFAFGDLKSYRARFARLGNDADFAELILENRRVANDRVTAGKGGPLWEPPDCPAAENLKVRPCSHWRDDQAWPCYTHRAA